MKAPWQSKTIWVNLLTLAIATLAFTAEQPWMTKDMLAVVVYAQGMANIVLRFLTDQPLSIQRR
jgi:uncharacterized membrane protein SirB2